jgi:aspartate/methionine/tyrosine aminotransferase
MALLGRRFKNNEVMTLHDAARGIELSPLIQGVSVSKTIEIHALTKEMESAGMEVFSLCVGEPDYQPPPEVITAISEAAKKGNTKYTAVTGTADLREAIADDLEKRKGVKYGADQIVVSSGAKQSIIQALLCVVRPGESVLIPSPYWTSYPDMAKICNAEPLIIETSPQDGYALSSETLRTALENNPTISAVIMCNPSNPTGCVMSREQQAALAEVLMDFPKVTIISDEIYEHLTYSVDHTSFASLPGMLDRTVVVNGFSKSHSMTGLRVGYAAAPLHVARACGKLQSQLTSCASSIGQYAATKALRSISEEWLPARVRELDGKRELMYRQLLDIPGFKCPKPDGAFYMLPDVSMYFGMSTPNGAEISNANDFCIALLREEGVALVPGEAFGANKCVRLSYAASEDLINESLRRLTRFVASLK